MESLTFYGDAFSEYYLTRLLWEEPRLQPLLGQQAVKASYRRSGAELLKAKRALKARQLSKSTRTLLLLPLADILGWNLGETEEIVETTEGAEDAGFPLLVDGHVLARVLAIAPDAPLDLPPTKIHRRFAPTLSMVRVLAEQDLTWGIVANAFELRLIRRAEGFISSSVGFDLTAIAEGSQAGFEAWKLLWALLRAEALEAEPPLLEQVVAIGRQHQEGVGKALGKQVQEAVVSFMQGLISHPANQNEISRPLTPEFLRRLYAESLRILYRLLFVLYGESRNLLPLDMPTYRDGYSLSRLAQRVANPDTDPRRRPTSSGRFFELSLKALFSLLAQGADLGPEGRIPQYGGALFNPEQTSFIESLVWGDNLVATVLDKLTLVPGRNGLVRLSYRELDVEQLGAIYESLLEQAPRYTEEPLYCISFDNREIIVNASERARLAHRRGETFTDSGIPDGEVEEELLEEEREEDDEGEEPEDEVPARRRTPIKIQKTIEANTIYLRPALGRKQTGSFYTSRPLVEFLVRRAIEPLAQGKSPEEILSLKVLDPAMGSGHFLVGACRLLSEYLLGAYRQRYEEVATHQLDLPPYDVFLEAGVHPEVARHWEHEEQALTACRLLVAGNCIYGVDKNPLAVDLARVSLWLATAATDHPLTFLDHRLRVGDSLVGLPVYVGEGEEPEVHLLKTDLPTSRSTGRRRREATEPPLLAGVPLVEVVTQTTRELRQRLTRALQHLRIISQLMDDSPGDFAGQRAAFNAMQGELQYFWELNSLRVGRRFLPAATGPELDLVNRWLAEMASLGHPSPEARRLAQEAIVLGEELGAFSWPLAFPEVFFGLDGQSRDRAGFDAVIGNPPWDKIKPNERECFAEFDPTVWDVQGQERRRLINQLLRDNPGAREAWDRHESTTKTLAATLLKGGLYYHQVAEVEGKKTGSDPDSFKFFTERAYQLLKEGGQAGIILPIGLQNAQGTTGLRRLLLDHCSLSFMVRLDNSRAIFPGVHRDQKFDLIVFAKGGSTETLEAVFYSWERAEVLYQFPEDPRRLRIEAELYRELSPETYTFVELKDQREVELLQRIYRRFPRLGEELEDAWNVSFTSELHMTGDSYLFRTAGWLKALGGTLHSRLPSLNLEAQGALWQVDAGGEYWTTPPEEWYEEQAHLFTKVERWVNRQGRVYLPGTMPEEQVVQRLRGFVPAGEKDDPEALPIMAGAKYVPLYEGRMVHQFDHCQKAYISGSGRRANWTELGWNNKKIGPHFFINRNDQDGNINLPQNYRLGMCLVTGQTNERTSLMSVIPGNVGCGHSLATTRFSEINFKHTLFLVSLINSFLIDWILRLQVSNNIGFYHLYGLPTPRTNTIIEGNSYILNAAAKLSCTSKELSDLWASLATEWQEDFHLPWSQDQACLDIHKRAQLRADIDARVAQLYGLTAMEFACIISTFPRLDRDQPPLPGDYFIRKTNKGEKVSPQSFITRDLALLTFLELTGQAPPHDIVAFFETAGIDIERQTGAIRDLQERVTEATRRGAVAYIPSTGKGYLPQDPLALPPDLPQALSENWEANISQWVIQDPQIHGGEPTLKGTRILVQLISDLLQQGWTFAQVLDSYPHLQKDQVAVAFRWGQLR